MPVCLLHTSLTLTLCVLPTVTFISCYVVFDIPIVPRSSAASSSKVHPKLSVWGGHNGQVIGSILERMCPSFQACTAGCSNVSCPCAAAAWLHGCRPLPLAGLRQPLSVSSVLSIPVRPRLLPLSLIRRSPIQCIVLSAWFASPPLNSARCMNVASLCLCARRWELPLSMGYQS